MIMTPLVPVGQQSDGKSASEMGRFVMHKRR